MLSGWDLGQFGYPPKVATAHGGCDLGGVIYTEDFMRKNLIILAGILTGVMAVVNYCQYETAMDSALEEVARFEQLSSADEN